MAVLSPVMGPAMYPVMSGIGSPGAGGGVSLESAIRSALFPNGEQGAWYDPSDFSTLFQDAVGTTPVTAVGQPVGLILDKRLPATSTAPLDALAFVPAGSTPPTAADTTFLSEACGSVTFPANAGGYTVSRGYSATTHPIVVGRRYTHSYRIALSRALTGGEELVVYTTGISGSDNSITLNSGTAGGVWIDFADATVVASATASGPNSCYVYAGTAIASPITIYVRQYTAKEIPGNHASQTNAASRPVLQQDGNGKYYLVGDGVDDLLRSSAFSGSGGCHFFMAAVATNVVQTWGVACSLELPDGLAFGIGRNSDESRFEFRMDAPETANQAVVGSFGMYTATPTIVSMQAESGIHTQAMENTNALATPYWPSPNLDRAGDSYIHIGGGPINGTAMSCKCYGLIYRRATSHVDYAPAREWLAEKAGVVL